MEDPSGSNQQSQQPNQEPSLLLQPETDQIQQPLPQTFVPPIQLQQTTARFPFQFGSYRNDRAPSVASVTGELGGINLHSPETPKTPIRRTPPVDENDPEFRQARKAFTAMGLIGKKHKIKVREPETYDGKKRGLQADQFIEACKLYFLVKREDFEDERMMIIFAISYLTDTAKTWASPILRDILGKQKKREARKWEAFEDEFVKAFGDPDKEAAAIRELEALITKGQRGPATHYASDFRRITMEIDWDEGTFIHYYRRGLKDEVKDALVYHPKPTSLEGLINLSIRLDERIWERKQEKNEGQHRAPPRPPPRNNPFLNQQNTQTPPPPSAPAPQTYRANPNQQAPNAFQHSQPVPIQIDANKRGPISAEEKAKRKQEGRCYYCGQTGHRASDHNLPQRPRQGIIDTTIAATMSPAPTTVIPASTTTPQSNNPFSPFMQQGFLPSA